MTTPPTTGLVHVGDAASLIAAAEQGQPRASLHERLDPVVFGYWMALIGDRIGRRLEEATLAVYRVELARRFDTRQFVAAARAIFAKPLFAQWPGPQEFADALTDSRPAVVSVPGLEESQRLRDYYNAMPPSRAEAVDVFGHLWRQALTAAGAAPDTTRARRGYGRPEDYAYAADPTPPQVPATPGPILRALQQAALAYAPVYPEREAVDAAVRRVVTRQSA